MEMKMNTSTMQCSQASSFCRRPTLFYQRLIIDNRLDAALQSFFFAADLVAPFCELLREDDIIAEAQPLGNEFSPGEKATFFLVGESWGKCSEPSKGWNASKEPGETDRHNPGRQEQPRRRRAGGHCVAQRGAICMVMRIGRGDKKQ
jgi:hypothetical protein